MLQKTIEFIPTGNTFLLPEDVVNDLMENDRGNYRIIGEENIPEVVEEPKTVAELVTGEKIEEKEIELLVIDKNGKEHPTMPVEQMDKKMCIALGKRLGLKGFNAQVKKEIMVDKLKEYFGE